MLQATAAYQAQSWWQVWQSYLLHQLTLGRYTDYQEVVLLWVVLFPEMQELRPISNCILQHFFSNDTPTRRCAQRFIATLISEIRDWKLSQQLNRK
jgi:hypothetical protein